MSSEAKLNVLTTFVKHRGYFLNFVNRPEDYKARDPQRELQNSPAYIALLMHTPVSKLSTFSDSVWDFNADYPNAARNIKGAKLRIDFSKFTEIPPFVLTEIKVIFELALLNNFIFKPQQNNGKGKVKAKLQANSLITTFEYGLSFINEIFKQATNDLGAEFVQAKIETLSDILPDHFQKAASNYERVKGRALDVFFEYLRSPASQKYVFDKPLAYVELNSLKWKKLANNSGTKKEQVLPDLVFESLSKSASLIVVDFLAAIGDRDKITDTGSLERLNVNRVFSWAGKERINHEIFTAYSALRLKYKNHTSSDITRMIEPYDWMLNQNSELMSELTLRKALRKRGYKVDSLREYINLVAYSCVYLVGQYTGMRPSELAEIRVKECSCLIEEDGRWLIKSVVKKHKEGIKSALFDDKWVAIPIVRDAILAASHIAKIKASPYLLSNVDTVKAGEAPRSMGSNGIKHQMVLFIQRLLGENVMQHINFHPYMLRHTLTYQLFKAEVGLPLISFQLKHFVESVSKYTSQGGTSAATLGYGEVGEMLSKDGGRKGNERSLRRAAELAAVKSAYDPNGIYYGGKAIEHKERLIKTFKGYIANGYSEEEVYEAMADQGVAIAYMGQGLCYGGRAEEYDTSLPCIGSLRCNPARCKQAVVTSQHAPKWREVYILNKANLNKPEYEHNRAQIEAAMNEAKMVLENLGEEVEL